MPTVGNFDLKCKWVIRSASMQADHLGSLGLWHWPTTAWCVFLAVLSGVCVCVCVCVCARACARACGCSFFRVYRHLLDPSFMC